MTRVLVVGGGASGALVAAGLLRRGLPVDVTVVEPRDQVGRGVAYGTHDPAHLLNVAAARMSARPDQPEHFLSWLRRAQPDAGPDTFAPRAAYGRYLADNLADAARQAAGVARVRHVRGHARDVEPGAHGAARVVLDDGATLEADEVVLALGNPPPEPLAIPGLADLDPTRFAPDPWAARAFDGLALDAPVLLIGTGLTAVDALVTLDGRGHRGVVHALSRHGLWPVPHTSHPSAHVAGPQPDFATAAVGLARTGLRPLLRTLREAADAGLDWRDVVQGLRAETPRVWQALSLGERARFLRHVQARWNSVRHRVPPQIQAALERRRAEHGLRGLRGRIARVSPAAAGVRVELRDGRVLEVARVVACTGTGRLLGPTGPELLRRLARRGLVRADALGLGLDATPEGALLTADGAEAPGLWTLGPPLRGILWESTAVPEIREQAHALAGRLLPVASGVPA